MTDILGISAFYHDSAACLVRDGTILATAQEERFTRKKQDPGFPSYTIQYCLREAHCTVQDLNSIVFYDKPLVKFERLLETYLSFAPRGRRSFVAALPVWLKEKLFLKSLLRKELAALAGVKTSALPPSCLPNTMRRTRRRRSSRPPSARRQSSAWTGSASGPRRQPGWGTTTSSRPCGTSPRLWDLILGGLLIALALAWPRSLTRVYRVWMTVGAVLGWINTWLILGMLFYLLFTLMGWGMRLRGKDPMRRRWVPEAESYRVVRQPRPASHMWHQF